MKKNYLFIALMIYGISSLATLFYWHSKGINTVTGDEPHYLVMTSGIINHGSLEQTAPYREEFETRRIYQHGLTPKDAQPSPENTHAVLGSHGLFNVHNIGLPLLLATPFLFGGVLGAKLMMVFFGALVIVAAWKFSSHFSENKNHRLWALIGAAIALPLVPASNQIYPDVLAGLITLTGLYWFLTAHERRATGLEALLAVTVAFLPWLQIKFAATCVVLVLSIAAKIYLQSRDLKRIILILIIAGASYLTLAAYNYYAFGNIYGPYQSGSLEVSKTSLMVLLGLHFDQNQGFILQNPVNLIGILAIGWMYKFNRAFSLAWALAFLSLIVPNALHPVWYGGWSISGRFQWAAAITFIIPSIYGLLVVAKTNEKLFKGVIIGGVILQIYFFYQYTIGGAHLYNKSSETPSFAYSIFFYPLDNWLPMLYNSNWAYGYWPNYASMLLIGSLLVVGFLRKINFRIKMAFLAVIFSSILLAGLSNNQEGNSFVTQASKLPSKTGSVINSHRFAKANTDKPGFINFGPYHPLRKGSYEVVFSYKSPAAATDTIGEVDIFNATSMTQLVKTPLKGTNKTTREVKIDFELTNLNSIPFEFRTYWNGVSDIELEHISLRKTH